MGRMTRAPLTQRRTGNAATASTVFIASWGAHFNLQTAPKAPSSLLLHLCGLGRSTPSDHQMFKRAAVPGPTRRRPRLHSTHNSAKKHEIFLIDLL